MSSTADGVRTLWVLRHAKASPANGARPDHDRPLAGAGARQALALGRLLADPAARARALLPPSGPALVLCSTARRTVETADYVVRRLRIVPEVRYLDLLYGAQPSDVIQVLGTVDDAVPSVLVVGHNPTAAALGGAGAAPVAHFPPCALSVVDLGTASWSQLDPGQLRAVAQIRPPYPEVQAHRDQSR